METEADYLERKRRNFAHLGDVGVDIEVEMGRKHLTLNEALHIKEQDVIELDKLTGESFSILANGTLFGEGEIAVITDLMAIRITRLYVNPRVVQQSHVPPSED